MTVETFPRTPHLGNVVESYMFSSEGGVQVESDARWRLLPWYGRTVGQWRRFVSKEEAATLLRLALADVELDVANKGSAQDGVKRWRLETLVKCFWCNGGWEEVVSKGRVWSDGDGRYAEEKAVILQELERLFADQRLFNYLTATRIVLKQRNLLSRSGALEGFDFSKMRAKILGWDKSELEEVAGQYQALIQLFYPMAIKFAGVKAKTTGEGLDDLTSEAHLNLVLAVSNFYWEPVVICPRRTLSHFRGSLFKKIQQSSGIDKFDTRRLEVPFEERVLQGLSGRGVHEIVEYNLSLARVERIIREIGGSAVGQRILVNKIFYGASSREIAREVGISEAEAQAVITNCRRELRLLAESGWLAGRRISESWGGGRFWGSLFAHIDECKETFEKRKHVLRKFHREVLELFFRLQTGEKNSTVRIVFSELVARGHVLGTQDTVRRAIQAGINQLRFVEPVNGQFGRSGWSRYQQARLVERVSTDPNVWNTFSLRDQRILKRFFIDGEGSEVSQDVIAKEEGLHPCIVSRVLDRCLSKILAAKGLEHLQMRPSKQVV